MGKLVVLIATLLVTALPLVLPVVPVRPVLLPAAAALLAMAWAARSAGAWPAVHVPLLFGLVFVWGAAAVLPDAWPLRALAPFLAYVVATALVPRLRETASWLRRGRVDRRVVALGALAIAIPALALVAWVMATAPDLSRWSRSVPDWSPAVLVVGLLLFSLVNAALEESIYRGVLLEGLDAALGRDASAVVLQGLAFGAIHFEGVPSGWIGVGMASAYGVMLGVVRRASGGLLAPIAVHVAADLVIVGILLAA